MRCRPRNESPTALPPACENHIASREAHRSSTSRTCTHIARGSVDDGTAVTGYPAVVLADHLAGYWRLGDAAALALDASGNGITGSYGSGLTQGVPGASVNDADTAAEFSGQTGAISLGNVFNFTGTTAFSVEAWIRPSVVDDNFRHRLPESATMISVPPRIRASVSMDSASFFLRRDR
jgi:hypothetical protein